MATIKKAAITEHATGWTYVFNNEHSVYADIGELNTDIQRQLMLHGLKQKLSDSYSGVSTDHEIEAAVKGVWNNLTKGLWNAGRSSLGGIWVEAIARAAGVELEAALAKWNDMDEDTRKDVKKNPQVKQAKAEIELERAKAKAEGTTIDLDAI